MYEIPEVVQVKVLEDYRLNLVFDDGARGVFDMRPYLERGVFRTLKDKRVFESAHIEYGTVVWPNEIDIAPERLYGDMARIAD